MSRRSSLKVRESALAVVSGVAIGVANVIPGVSGGTMALMLGIYGRLLAAVSKLTPRALVLMLRAPRQFLQHWAALDLGFLACIGGGAVLAVAVCAKAIVVLLTQFHDPTYGFFWGLIAASLIVPLRLIEKKSWRVVVAFVVGASLVVFASLSAGKTDAVANAKRKAAMKTQIRTPASSSAALAVSNGVAHSTPKRQAVDYLTFLGAGFIAISAMILPGISGSFLLLLMGVYFDLLAAIVTRDIALLGMFSLGCLLGLVVSSRAIQWMLSRYASVTFGGLAGLVAGSLYTVWPFKAHVMVAGRRVDLAHQLPTVFGPNEWATVATCACGLAIVALFVALQKRVSAK